MSALPHSGPFAVPARPKIVSPYIRVSKIMGREDEAFLSPEIQLDAIRADIAKSRAAGIPVVEGPIFRDIDETGADFRREGIQAALAAKKRGEIDGIATLDVSRVGRTASETLAAIDAFTDDDGVYMSSRERIDPTPEGRLVLLLWVGLAEQQLGKIAAGWQAAIRKRIEKGFHNGTPPTGYKRVRRENGRTEIVFDDVKAPAILEAFLRYDAGDSATSIETRLRANGVLAANGVGKIKSLLSNPFYVGDVVLNVYTGRAKKRVRTNLPPLRYRGVHPALLRDENGEPDTALFERVQTRLAREKRTAKRYIDPLHALGGLVKCAECGRSLTYQAKTSPLQRGAYYRDINGRRDGCSGIGSAYVEDVESKVRTEVRRFFERFEIGDADLADALAERSRKVAEKETLEARIAKLEDAIADADADLYAEVTSPERHRKAVARLEERLAAAKSALDAIGDLGDVPTTPELVAAAKRLDDEWDAASPARRNALLRAARVGRVEIRGPLSYREPAGDRTTVFFAI